MPALPEARRSILRIELVAVTLLVLTLLILLLQDRLLQRSFAIDGSAPGNFVAYPLSDGQAGGASVAAMDASRPLAWGCRIREGYAYPYCGVDLVFDPAFNGNGIDLTGYDSVEIALDYRGPAERLVAELKNFDPRYSQPGVAGTMKFNAADFRVAGERVTTEIKLSEFHVAEWWVTQQQLPPELSQPELDNIASMSIATSEGNVIGDHRFQIRHIVFKGQYLPPARVHLALLGFWIVFALLCLLLRILSLKRDIKARAEAESRTELLQSQLIHVSRVSAMGEMASALAHEINQPLSSIASYMAGARRLLASDRPDSKEKAMEALSSAEEAALRAGDIIRRLREMVSGKVERNEEDLAQLVRQISTIALVDANFHGITPLFDIDNRCRWVVVDKVQIQQVILNLIRNGIQAMEGEPERTLTIRTACAPGDMVEVSVADTGCGIPPSLHQSLFTAFQSTKSEGMGIGLSISRTIVEAHGGNIWAENGETGGTVFRFTVPSASPAAVGRITGAKRPKG